MACKVCRKQYVGSTAERFRFRWNNYKSCKRKDERREGELKRYLEEHILSEDHNGLINDVETDLSDSTRREEF